jgi:hypothetical protein
LTFIKLDNYQLVHYKLRHNLLALIQLRTISMSHTGTISKKATPKSKGVLKTPKSASATNPVRRYFAKLKTKREANKQANKIIRSLNEAKEIKAGTKAGVTFDDFLTTF